MDGKLPNILITGTPGVGKTSFAILLQEKLKEIKGLDFKNINIGILVNEKNYIKIGIKNLMYQNLMMK